MLTQHTKIPTIEAKTLTGEPFHSSFLQGKRVYLTFLRTAACPFCNLRVHELIKRTEYLHAQDIEVVAVFASTTEHIMQHAGKQHPTFIILADPEERLYKQFGLTHSRLGMFKAMLRIGTLLTIMKKGFFTLRSMMDPPVLPADFLIKADQTIHTAYYGKDFRDHLSFEQIEAW